MELIFATNNQNKVAEIKAAVNSFSVITLKQAGIEIEIPEPHNTLEENATEKSSAIYQLTGKNCFSEDSGLEADALNGAPGVRSARYAGDKTDDKKNIELLLHNLQFAENRNAQFKTVISLMLDKKEYQFTGICKGEITKAVKGEKGFGYDSVFIPEGAQKTFGEMDTDEKNRYSHRKKAVVQLTAFLNRYHGKD